MSGPARELTRTERAGIRKLVSQCANFDRDYGCLPLDCECYMLGKWWTGAFCNYFENAVLPLDPVLQASLLGLSMPDTATCPVCGQSFVQQGKQAYCSAACASAARKKRQREYMRKKRASC